jgi:tripartite-type tricarboxylate transporter receptor subunit TctC
MTRIASALLSAAVCALVAASVAAADRYPVRPIRLIAGFPPGGGVDINARILADSLGAALGQTILVDNRPGAGGRLGIELVSKAAPDGYTLGLGGIGMAISRALYDNLPYDTLRDFVPISLLTGQPNILVAHPSLPAKSFPELIALARAQPGKLSYSTSGIGTGVHLATELLAQSQKVQLLHVPYKGTAPALNGLLANEVSVSLSTFASALPHVKAERLRAFAVTSKTRAKALPAVPTVAESGSPDYEYSTWYGLIAPAGVPRRIVEHLNTTSVAVLNTPEVRQRYEAQGLDPIPSTSAHYAAYLRSETEKWMKVVRAANIALQ